jgi:cyclic-di-AMP phosphodiesterase PgpH
MPHFDYYCGLEGNAMSAANVSKTRTEKTKQRQKKAGKTRAGKTSIFDSPVMGLLIAFVLWIALMFGLRMPDIMRFWSDPKFLLPLISDAVFSLAGLFAAGVFLRRVRPEYIARNSRIILMGLAALLTVALAVALQHAARQFDIFPKCIVRFLMPVALAPLLVTLLLGSRAALVTGLWTALVLSLHMDRSLPVLIQGTLATAVAMLMVRKVRKRAMVIRAGAVIGLSQIICVFGSTALDWTTPDIMTVLHQAASGLISGVLSAVLVLLILPLFEHIFAITTDISLLEFSDLGHPLLQRLAIEAPGTYHHSLVVANIAQAAADSIGVNSLEARVCAYFHDIGKLTKPGFFTENIHMQSNPHDDLPPSMSTLVITSHVKEGLSLAYLHKLPKPVIRIIREHHGTSMVSYFHHKAKTQLEFEMGAEGARPGDNRIDEGAFRYPGPRPTTAVSAIICLADAVEAASRSMEKPTPGHIEGLINDIVRNRLDDGQLDDCDLRLCDLMQVKRAFVFTLTTMLHGRVPYPKDEDSSKQSAKDGPRGEPAAEPADVLDDAANEPG